ncbi:MAG: phosphoenolpyruvate carboxylase [Pyrinomonadaceae bacterium]|nr:phosphoenolpyruvate carboxylase [Pyrinomonadaceae bacterium]
MSSYLSAALKQFQNQVVVPFQLYNSLFTSLPFNRIEKTGILLSLFASNCEERFADGQSPAQIVTAFFDDNTSIKTDGERIDLLFRFVQYAERQVVLFDALEDSAFETVNDLNGTGTISHLEAAVLQNDKKSEMCEKLRDFNVRLVLTAHPTQFYPDSVLGIINDLVEATAVNNVSDINTYLQQLGRTPFIKQRKPTPFDEAVSLIWYLENVFYDAVGNVVSNLNEFYDENLIPVKMGFWSGGDRDGNPFVKVETTLQVAAELHRAIRRSYIRDVRKLKRRLTFSGVETILSELETKLTDDYFDFENGADSAKQELLKPLREIQRIMHERYNGLFVNLVNDLIYKVESFGWHFATLDIRQESSIHTEIIEQIAAKNAGLSINYPNLSDEEKIAELLNVKQSVNIADFTDELTVDTLKTITAIKTIQRENGEEGCHRYIISQCQSALNAIEVYGLLLLSGWDNEELNVDIVPLFETVKDLESAAQVMKQLYENTVYREHLSRRKNNQSIMLGFSDGTKDGGYLTANWSIYKAKKELTEIAENFGVNVIFFDGRGGPPARGGGKTHKFYSSMGAEISDKSIELTIQGQTVSSNFGTIAKAQFNIEQLLHAGLYKEVLAEKRNTFTTEETDLLQNLADESFKSYQELKNHPLFLDYLSNVSPLRFYAEANIGSRPAKRGAGNKLEFKDLRAIPFVGAWSQIKQNVPGYYGVGAALQKADDNGNLAEVSKLYKQNAFFKALVDNCEMAMQKCFFPLTRFLSDDGVYGELWRKIFDEFELTRRYLLLISGKKDLMDDYPIEQQSIGMRERIMLPLNTIQQYSLTKLRESDELSPETKSSYEKLIIRCSFGIINAGRNSA